MSYLTCVATTVIITCMSNSRDKIIASRRRLKDENAVRRQTRIAQSRGAPVSEPHKFAKRHAMDCGRPGCMLCGNPRKTFKERTVQEKRMFQNLDKPYKGSKDEQN
jgi:hypothetical protein